MIINKIKASLIHLVLSFVVISITLIAIIYFWFPLEYLKITNFKDIALLIISIDLILGPLLTFIVFNPTKKSLRFDLTIIAIIQLTAFSYGVNALYNTHPLYISFNHGSFNLIQANEVTPLKAKYKQFKISKLSSPKLAFAKMPQDPKLQYDIMFGVDLKGDPDIDKRTEFFEPIKDNLDTILKNSLDTAKLFNEKNITPELKDFLEQHDGNKSQYAYLPLKGFNGNAIIVLNKQSGEAVTTINTTPWKFTRK